jgi:hypothetical protein
METAMATVKPEVMVTVMPSEMLGLNRRECGQGYTSMAGFSSSSMLLAAVDKE